MLLLYPPVAKPSEPPAGIAQLAGVLRSHNIRCDTVDLNIEGLHYLLAQTDIQQDTWSRRALKNKNKNIEAIRSIELFSNPAKYQKCVLELNRILEVLGGRKVTASLVNYQDRNLSPLRSSDLLHIAEHPQLSIFHAFLMSRLIQLLDTTDYRHIGISINYLSQALTGFALIGCIKKLSPKSKIIVGGGLLTSWMSSSSWQNPFTGLIDLCVDGCGEQALLSLFKTQKVNHALPDFTKERQQKYLSPGFILPYSTSSGCFWNKCSFCPEKAEGNTFQKKSSKTVTAELTDLWREYQPTLIHFLDNAIPPATLKMLAVTPDMPQWYGFARISQQLLDLDFCRQLKKCGCQMLKLGIESGHQGVLDEMDKGIAINTVSRVLKNLKAAGIHTYVYLLFGTPSETHEKAQTTLQFTKNHYQEITFLNLAIFNMPVNSRESTRVQTSKFYSGDLSLYSDFTHPHGWDRKKVRVFLDREFKRHPAISRILQRDPPLFTSNHAAFFCKFLRP